MAKNRLAYNDIAGMGEISDATLLSNGTILFTHQFGVILIKCILKADYCLRKDGGA
jgi:hypothetical protein